MLKKRYERLHSVISTEHTVKEVIGTSSKGSYNLDTGTICVRSDLEYLQKIKTLLHEYAHAVDFSLYPGNGIKRNRRELIAESVAFVVAMRLGLDTSSYSMSYIKSWLKDKEELKIIADTVQTISSIIINKLAESSDSAFSILKEKMRTNIQQLITNLLHVIPLPERLIQTLYGRQMISKQLQFIPSKV